MEFQDHLIHVHASIAIWLETDLNLHSWLVKFSSPQTGLKDVEGLKSSHHWSYQYAWEKCNFKD
jgi:hypothetical protein